MRYDPWSGLILLACTILAIALLVLASASTDGCPTDTTCELR